jgi:hypothetical protein
VKDIAPTLAALVLVGAPLSIFARSLGRNAPLVLVAGVVQFVAALIHVAIVRSYYGYGDMISYWRSGMALAQGLESGWIDFTEVLRLILQIPTSLAVLGSGRSTGSMHGISGLLCYVFNGSLVAACVFISLVGFAGRLAFWSVVRNLWPSRERALLVACLVIPSTVFWSAGLLKEAVAMPGLFLAAASVVKVVETRRLSALSFAGIAAGVPLVALTKPYLLFPLLIGVTAAGFIRARVYLTRAASPEVLVATVGLIALGELFPRYALENVVDSAEDLRRAGETHAGGSSFEVPRVALVPLGVLTALFRPLLLEARNPLLALSALEMTIFSVLFLRALWRPRAVIALAQRSRLLLLSAGFVAVFSVALGISTTNLGTLARYRAPMMPFYAVFLIGAGAAQRRLRLPASRKGRVSATCDSGRCAPANRAPPVRSASVEGGPQ